ncbi:MAG: transglutaminase-like domain-containing protein [Ruminococcus sp.]
MKNKTEFFVSSGVSLTLMLSLLWCFSSSFSVSASPFVVVMSTLIFTSYFAFIAKLVERKLTFLMCHLVTAAVFIFTVLFSFETLLSQLNYAANCVLEIYSKYLPCPSAVVFSSTKSASAEYLFVLISFLLSSAFVNSLVRIRRIYPIVMLSVLVLVPCFIIVDTLPLLAPLIVAVSLLFALYVTSFVRRKNPAQSGAVMLGATAVILIISIIICYIFPVENYKRYEWQDNLLSYAEKITGLKGGQSSDSQISSVGNFIDDTEDLTKLGRIEQQGKKVMRILTDKGGTMYLKGVSYANYSDNKWSILTDEQNESRPQDYNSFTMAKSDSEKSSSLSIITENGENIMYTPYFTKEIPTDFEAVSDVLVKNKFKYISYELSYLPYSENEVYYSSVSSSYYDYKDFVYDTYTQLPEETSEKLIEIGEQNGIYLPRFGGDENQDSSLDGIKTNAQYAELVKDFVSSVGFYSLDAEIMPEGVDFPVWFLTEAKSGYCVHYAAAAAAMLRAYGVPTRYVTGYLVNAKAGEWTVVTSDNAHAWAEYFDDEMNCWIPLDATPASFAPAQNNSATDETKAMQSSLPTEPATTVSQSATNTTEKTTEMPSVTNNNSDKENTGYGAFEIVITVIIILLLLIATVLIRRKILLSVRNKRFSKGRNNSRAIYIYRHIESLGRFSNNVIPDELKEIALKARFSSHTVSSDELKMLLSYHDDAEKELLRNSSKIKRFYFKFILAITK